MTTIHITIKGKVQGVFYRDSAKNQADKLGLTGWIKNTDDGNVEVMISGDNIELDQFVQWCKLGSDKSKVEGVSFDTVDDKKFSGFTISH
ncbi:MAG: acylphosphatase [Ginsengibacter sp.]